MNHLSIFEQYYSKPHFLDRFLEYRGESVTVIIPTIHTNELWEANLLSIYREIPVKQLLIGDGGCIDDTLIIAQKFPRVVIHDHKKIKSLGYSIKKLIEAVETDWFIYLHSDVYLPNGWFDKMMSYRGVYDWFGCRMQQTVMVEFDNDYGPRPYAGSQIGRKVAFTGLLDSIDDDFIYRQEDFIFSDIVSRNGYREGKVDEIFHYHQTIKKPSPLWNPQNVRITISQDLSSEEEFRVWDSQFRGVIKYLPPSSSWAIREAGISAFKLIKLKAIQSSELFSWVNQINPEWLPHLRRELRKQRIKSYLHFAANLIKSIYKFD